MNRSALEHEIILIIEDSQTDSAYIKRIAENHGGVGFVARSFQEAALIASHLKVTAVTIDLDMGEGESGLSIVSRLQHLLGDDFKPRMLVISGAVPDEDQVRWKSGLPLVGVLAKPVCADSLVSGLSQPAVAG